VREGRAGPTAVRVVAPARLHLGFLDPTGGPGRRFLGLGLSLEAPVTAVRVEVADRDRIEGPEAARVGAVLARLRADRALPPVRIRVEAALPAHAGLGSGTQLALAVGTALLRLAGRPGPPRRLAARLGRGRRSGLGVAAFARGGFLLDGGKGADGAPPPLLARLPFPAGWRVVLLRDPAREGLSGAEEERAFRTLPPFPEPLAARLAHLALACVLPGVADADLRLFGRGLAEIQDRLGDWYAPFQAAGRWSSPVVARALAELRARGIAASGQSSWGPTGFAVVPAPEAEAVAADLARAFPELRVEVVRGRNRGARIETIRAPAGTCRGGAGGDIRRASTGARDGAGTAVGTAAETQRAAPGAR